MESVTITTYMCNRSCVPGIEIHAEKPGIEVSGNIVTARIIDDTHDPSALPQVIDAFIQRGSTAMPFICDGVPLVTWEPYEIDCHPMSSVFDGDEFTSIMMRFKNPDSCLWRASKVESKFFGTRIILQPSTAGGEIPDNKEDVIPWAGVTYGLEIDNCATTTSWVIPGEDFTLYYAILTGTMWQVAKTYFHTLLNTGGEIVARWDSGEGWYTYDVKVEGRLFSDLWPTDFYEYAVGEWVQIARVDSAGNIDPLTMFDNELKSDEELVIVPHDFVHVIT